MKFLTAFSIFFAVSTFSCKNGNKVNEPGIKEDVAIHNEHNEHDHEHSHEHVFYCPLHQEMESDEPTHCPKCGTEMEFLEDENMERYAVEFTKEPLKPAARNKTVLYFKPYLVNHVNNDVLLVEKPTLLVTDQKLSSFEIIDLDSSASGKWKAEYTFPENQYHLLFFEYMPKNAPMKFSRQLIKPGMEKYQDLTAKKETRKWKSDNIEVELKTGNPFEFNISTLLKFNLKINGKAAEFDNNIKLFIISYDLNNYLFVNQLEAINKKTSPAFHTLFPKIGFYKVFLQFSHNNTLHNADFIIEVKT